MLQEEVSLIAEKLKIADFVASNGWLKKIQAEVQHLQQNGRWGSRWRK